MGHDAILVAEERHRLAGSTALSILLGGIPLNQDRLIDRNEAAQMLALQPQTLARWAMDGRHLKVVKLGRTARYRLSDVLRLVEHGTRQDAG